MILYFDCYSGISGDMVLGALVDAGLSPDVLRSALDQLPIQGYHLDIAQAREQGLTGTRATVRLDPSVAQPARRLADIEAILKASDLPATVKERALGVFRRLARVEARIHGTTPEEVHFHEVGAVDAIVDVVGAMVGLETLGVRGCYASSLPTGSGMVETAHGPLPVPAPATLALLAEVSAPIRPCNVEAELVTPTGAAILAEVATFAQPPMHLHRVAYGFGQRKLPWPNALRLWLGEESPAGLQSDEVVVLEANVDDMPGELLGYALERLLTAGALDVYFAPIHMKKSRPGVLLGVIAPPALASSLAQVVLGETTTLGVRYHTLQRYVVPRREEVAQTTFGPVRVKVKVLGDREVRAPEYEDCARAAREHGVPLSEVYAAALRAAAP